MKTNSMMRIRRSLGAAIVATALTALVAPSGAQTASSSRWSAWMGCWASTINGLSQVEIDNLPTVCVAPTSSADVVEISTIAKGQVVSRDTIDASGTARSINAKDCAGTKSATWSGDQRRVYLRSTFTCGSNKTTVSSIIAMNDLGQWLDVRGVASGNAENVRVARYRPVSVPEVLREQMPASVRDRLVLEQGARIAAGAPFGTSAILEASKMADSSVVEAWVLERNQRMAVDADVLIQLADAGVASNVTDAIVAVSNPKEFAIASTEQQRDIEPRRVTTVMAEPLCSPYSSIVYSPYYYGVSAYDYDRYGCSYYGYRGYGSTYGYNGYYGGGFYGPYRPPVIVVVAGSGTPVNGGPPVAIKGRGYTQGSGGTATTSSTRSSGPSQPSSSSSSSSSTSQPAQTAQPAQSAPAQTEQRTAKPRNP